MSDCDDEIVIAETYSDALSVEVLGYNGNDRIVLGDKNRPLEKIIFANIILDGGEGSRDVLVVNDQGTTTAKPIEVRATKVTGIHNRHISYFDMETIDIGMGIAAQEVHVFSTAKSAGLTLSTQGKAYTNMYTGFSNKTNVSCAQKKTVMMSSKYKMVSLLAHILTILTSKLTILFFVCVVQGPLKILSGCGNDVIEIKQNVGDITLKSGAGLFSMTNVTIENTIGDIDIDFRPAKSHTMNLTKTVGDIFIDTGYKCDECFIVIDDSIGDIDVNVGSGDTHYLSFTHILGHASVDVDLGEKIISADTITGSFKAKLTNGNEKITISKVEGDIEIKSGDGLHEYELNETSGGAVDISVGDSNWLHHIFNLTSVFGSVKISAGDGDNVINGYGLAGSLTGVFGDGDHDMTLANAAVDVDLTSGKGYRNIVATNATSFKAVLGDGDDRIELTDTGTIHIKSGDGLHKAKFLRSSGSIDVAVGNAVGRGRSQSLTIIETIGDVTVTAGKGNYQITTQTTDGEVVIQAGESHTEGIIDVRDTVNGNVNVIARTNTALDILNTEGGSNFNGDVSVVVYDQPCIVNVGHASGDVSIDLQGSGIDRVDLFDIGGSVDIKTWSDNDLITVDKLHGSIFVDAGTGDDRIQLDYLGGNGTVLGGTGDDLFLIDPRGDTEHPNTMDGSHLDWNGGGGIDSVDMIVVSSGIINLNFYNTGIDQINTRCSSTGDSFTPSFSLGRQPQILRNRLDGYLFVDLKDCCEARE